MCSSDLLMAALWPVAEQDERRRRKSTAGEGPAVVVAVLPLVRIWVRGEAALTRGTLPGKKTEE